MNKKGFTLIELLVVIAIIGLLSSLAIISLSGARNKAFDAQIKSDLNQVRAYSVLEFEDGDYSTFTISSVQPTLTAPGCSSYTLNASDADWVAYAPLCSDDTVYFCVDSAGQAKEVATAPTTNVCP